MELPADGLVWLSNGLVVFFLGLFVYTWRVDRNWMRGALKELHETVDRYAAEAKAEREKGFAEMKEGWVKGFAEARADRMKGFAEMKEGWVKGFADARADRLKGFAEAKAERVGGLEEAEFERESLYSLLLQVAERTARIEGLLQGRAEMRLKRQLQELIEERRAASSAASD